MDPVTEIFTQNIVVVYFVYGLAFFSMGLVVWLESRRNSEFRIARAMGLLAGFGILHGLHEWFEMFQILSQSETTSIPGWLLLDEIRIPHLVLSFLLLAIFGVRLQYAIHRKDGHEQRFAFVAAAALFAIWLASVLITRLVYEPDQAEFVTASDVLARYIIGIPGAVLAAWAIILEQRSFKSKGMAGFGRDLRWAAWALILYGMVGQLFPKESFLFPSTVLNSQLFIDLFGIPVQFFRAVQAMIMAFFVFRALRAFEFERQQRLDSAHEARLAAQRQALETHKQAQRATDQLNRELRERETLLGQLLQKVVSAQEGERERIARELHDGTGQILTALGLGLAAAGESIRSDPDLAAKQLSELKHLNAEALQELHDLIGDLRPAILDDLGLIPALKGQVREFEARTGVEATFRMEGRRHPLRPDIETIVFRIGQEALTNIAKHANAEHVSVELCYNERVLQLVVQDDGQGFDPEEALHVDGPRRAWGLLGMQERVALVGGACNIESQPGSGTRIEATIPRIGTS